MNKADLLEHMSYDSLSYLRSNHPTWRLLSADNASFIMSFLYREFIGESNRDVAEHVLISHLESHIETVPSIKENKKTAKDYLSQWADDSYGWLRRFYPKNSDEVHYDLTSTAQKAIEWIVSLKQNNFIGTESRLILVFDLLHQISEQSETNPETRIRELEKQKKEIEAEIANVKKGEIKVLEPSQVRERFMQAIAMAREILADFRAVEQNFRDLNRKMREKIAVWDKSKGQLIGDYFSDQNAILKSDQGRSFQAFFDFLMSRNDQQDLDNTLDYLRKLEPLGELINSSRADEIADDWLEGSQHVWATVEAMSEQLKRYVDENYIREERRINQIIKSIEGKAISFGGELPKGMFMTMEETNPDIRLPYERTLFSPPKKTNILDEDLSYGTQEAADDALYNHISINKEKLIANINKLLKDNEKVSLASVVEEHPLKFGLTELIGYMSIESDRIQFTSDDSVSEPIAWVNQDNQIVKADLPKIIYYRRERDNYGKQ